MDPIRPPSPASQQCVSYPIPEVSVPQLVGQLYATSSPPDRSRLLEFLMRRLGILALVPIADGIFSTIRFRSGWPDPHVALEDANRVQAGDIVQLVDRVQHVGFDAIDGLAVIVASSPVIASSATAALLVALLLQGQQARRAARQLAQPDPDLDPLT